MLNLLESPPFGRVPLNSAGAPTYPYDIVGTRVLDSSTNQGESAGQTSVSKGCTRRRGLGATSWTIFILSSPYSDDHPAFLKSGNQRKIQASIVDPLLRLGPDSTKEYESHILETGLVYLYRAPLSSKHVPVGCQTLTRKKRNRERRTRPSSSTMQMR